MEDTIDEVEDTIDEVKDILEKAPEDITYSIFNNQSVNCSEYINKYSSNVDDVNEGRVFDGELQIEELNGKCVFSTNAIPNHDFNDGERTFVTNVTVQDDTYSITKSPSFASEITPLSLGSDNAIFLNGVKLDLLAAGCYGIGDGKIGCGDDAQPFRYDPMSPLNDFGTDSHNAHTQPNGGYHYHGNPMAMFHSDVAIESPVIGFAADGYPIFGSYFYDGSVVRKAKSNYKLKNNGGARADITYNGVKYSPSGNYDGKFVDDYSYSSLNGGDLDECNGMTVNGSYGYYVTEDYPWIMKCYKGTPDSSFNKK